MTYKSDDQIKQEVLRELRWDTRVSETEIGVTVQRGIVFEDANADAPKLEIMLGGETPHDPRHLTHSIERVRHINAKTAADGRDEALEIQDAEGVKTLLRFESLPELRA